MLEERVKRWTRDWKQQGMEEGLKEGRQEGRQDGRREGLLEGRVQGERLLLQRQLARRFGELDAGTLERIKQADEPDLQRWADALLDAERLEDVFG